MRPIHEIVIINALNTLSHDMQCRESMVIIKTSIFSFNEKYLLMSPEPKNLKCT